jgi:hypothetical protein
MPVRALGGDAERDARRLFVPLANPAAEHLVGVGRPLALMQHLKPGFDREGLDEASAVGDVLIDSPRIGAIAPSRISKLVDRAQELGPIVGFDAIFDLRRRPAPGCSRPSGRQWAHASA